MLSTYSKGLEVPFGESVSIAIVNARRRCVRYWKLLNAPAKGWLTPPSWLLLINVSGVEEKSKQSN